MGGVLEQLDRGSDDDGALARPDASALFAGRSGAEMTIDEDEDKFTVTTSAPGIDAADLNVSVDDGMLTITGQATVERPGGRASSFFSRSTSLPADADGDVVSTRRNEDGTLSIELQKQLTSDSRSLASEIAAEAEALARSSPRFARWLKANGFVERSKQVLEESDEQ